MEIKKDTITIYGVYTNDNVLPIFTSSDLNKASYIAKVFSETCRVKLVKETTERVTTIEIINY